MFDEKRFNSDDYEYRQECLFWVELYLQWAKREQEIYMSGGGENE